MKDEIKKILENIGITDEEVLENTPTRVSDSCKEFFSGYNTEIEEIANKTYESEMNEMVILSEIPFESCCEHHLVPIIGKATIGYVPNGKIIGASKLARILDCFAHRLQLQERMTMEVARAIDKMLNPKAVAVYVSAEHFCISHRGVKKHGAKLITKYFLGDTNQHIREEFLRECRK